MSALSLVVCVMAAWFSAQASAYEVVTVNPEFVSVVHQLTFGEPFGGEAALHHPSGIAIDRDGNVIVADTETDHLDKFSRSGQFLGAFGSGGPELSRPTGIVATAAGDIWVSDSGNHRLQEFGPEGLFLRKVEAEGTEHRLERPEGLAVDSEGDIWVADNGTSSSWGRIEEFSPSGTFLAEIDGEESVTHPVDVAIGLEDHVWVVNDTNNFSEFEPDGELMHVFPMLTFAATSWLGAIATDPQGRLWVADERNFKLYKLDQRNLENYETREFPTTYSEFGGWSGSGGSFNFQSPFAITTDGQSHVWIADSGDNNVQRWFEPLGQQASCFTGEVVTPVGKEVTLAPGALECDGEAPLEWELKSSPSHGAVSGFNAEDGSLTYTPEAEFSGVDSLTFAAQDELGEASPKTFYFKVGELAACEDAQAHAESGTSTTFSLHCAGSPTPEYEIVDAPVHGEVTSFNASTGEVTYAPEEGFVGYDSLTFHATNALGPSLTKTLEIQVGDSASCDNGGAVTAAETPLAIDLPCGGSGTLEYELRSGPNHGELSEVDLEAGTMVYTSESGYEGYDSFQYRVRNLFGASPWESFLVDVGDKGPIAAYAFEEGEGTQARDWARGHTGTIENATWAESPYEENALAFDPVSESMVKVPDAQDLQLKAFTIQAWVRPHEDRTDALVAGKLSSAQPGYALFAGGSGAGGHPEIRLTDGEATEASVMSAEALPLDTWSVVAATYDGTQLKLYVDNQLVGETEFVGFESGGGALGIGGSEAWAEHLLFDGRLDDVEVFDHALTAEELGEMRDRVAPTVKLGGPLAESAEGPLGVESAQLQIEAEDGESGSGVKGVLIAVDHEKAAAYSCPCEMPLSFEYEKSAWGKGPHTVTVTAVDRVGYGASESIKVDTQEGPGLALGGSLYERRQGSVGVGLLSLEATASETDGSAVAPRPGVKSIGFEVDGVSAAEETQECVAGNCGLEAEIPFDPSSMSAGWHTISVSAEDQAGNVSRRRFEVRVPAEFNCANSKAQIELEEKEAGEAEGEGNGPRAECPAHEGSLQQVEDYLLNPDGSKEYEGEEWIEPGTTYARSEDRRGQVSTRGLGTCEGGSEEPSGEFCEEVRSEPRDGWASDLFTQESHTPEDPRLDSVAFVNRFHRADFEEPVASGPEPDVLKGWQDPPVGHGPTYELFEQTDGAEGPTFKVRWWVDGATGLPIRWAMLYERPGGGQTVAIRRLFSYKQTPPSLAEVPAGFFVAPRPFEVVDEYLLDVEQEGGEPEEPETVEEE